MRRTTRDAIAQGFLALGRPVVETGNIRNCKIIPDAFRRVTLIISTALGPYDSDHLYAGRRPLLEDDTPLRQCSSLSSQ